MAEAAAVEAKQSNPRTVSGVVVSDSMDKTITVRIDRKVKAF